MDQRDTRDAKVLLVIHRTKRIRFIITSQLKIDSNRRNSRASTGPQTDAGRAASSRNSLWHGFSAKKYLLSDEDPEEFQLYLKGLIDARQPADADEYELVHQIATSRWRHRRILRADAAIFDRTDPAEAYYSVPDAVKHLGSHENNVRKTLTYLEKRLKEVQAERRDRAATTPAAEIPPAVTVPTGEAVPEKLAANDSVPATQPGPGEADGQNQKTKPKNCGADTSTAALAEARHTRKPPVISRGELSGAAVRGSSGYRQIELDLMTDNAPPRTFDLS